MAKSKLPVWSRPPAAGKNSSKVYASRVVTPAAPTSTAAAPAAASATPVDDPTTTPGTPQNDSYQYLTNLYESYGLGSLAPLILSYAEQGYSQDTIAIMLQQTPEWKKRFAGNEQRIANGYAVLSPAEYLGQEQAYRQVLNYAGLPTSFYDSPDDFANWIGGDASPKEIEDRVGIISKWVNSVDPSSKQALMDYYGVGDSELIAYGLDRTRAEPILAKQAAAAELGASALRQNLTLDKARAEMFADQGATTAAFGQVAQVLPVATQLGQIFGQDYSQTDAENEFLGNSAEAQRKRLALAGKESDVFSGSSGTSSKGLGRRTAGAY